MVSIEDWNMLHRNPVSNLSWNKEEDGEREEEEKWRVMEAERAEVELELDRYLGRWMDR